MLDQYKDQLQQGRTSALQHIVENSKQAIEPYSLGEQGICVKSLRKMLRPIEDLDSERMAYFFWKSHMVLLALKKYFL